MGLAPIKLSAANDAPWRPLHTHLGIRWPQAVLTGNAHIDAT